MPRRSRPADVSRRGLLAMAALSLAAGLGAVGLRAAEEASAPARSLFIPREGTWLLYKGHLRLEQRTGEEQSSLRLALEVAYLGRGPAPAAPEGAGERAAERPGAEVPEQVLLLRSGESQESPDLAFSEAVSLLVGSSTSTGGPASTRGTTSTGGQGARLRFPLEERAARVSPLSFTYLPLDLAPPLGDVRPRAWRGPARVQLLHPEPREAACAHRIEAGQRPGEVLYTREAEPGQRFSFLHDRLETTFELTSLKEAFTLSSAAGPGKTRLLRFRSSLKGRFPGAGGAGESPGGMSTVEREIDLELSEDQALEGERWTRLAEEARRLEEIERTLFAALDPDGAESKAKGFEAEHPSSRLRRFAAGLAHQAEDMAPIARERKLYGKPAPDFTLPALSGGEVTLSRIVPGKVTLLSYWSVG